MVGDVCVHLMSLSSPAFETLPQRVGFLVHGQFEPEAKDAVVRPSYRAIFPIAHA